jgi:inositol phosphorylceramide synthase catalytic subunit
MLYENKPIETNDQHKTISRDPRYLLVLGTILFPSHFLLTSVFQGLQIELLVVDMLATVLCVAGPRTRRLMGVLLPFWIAGAAYLGQGALIGFRVGDIHIADLHAADRFLFGVPTSEGRIALPFFLGKHPNAFADVVTGLAYFLYLPAAMLIAGALAALGDRAAAARLGWRFCLATLLGILVYLLFPAAPPWYVKLYGEGPAVLSALPDLAGTARFDEITGLGLFAWIYSKSANVFGAMPSLHVAFVTVPALVVWPRGGAWRWLTLLFALLVASSRSTWSITGSLTSWLAQVLRSSHTL